MDKAAESVLQNISNYIDERDYEKGLNLTDKALSRSFDLSDKNQEMFYEKLIRYRVTLRTLLNREDEIIHDFVRKEKFPSESIHIVGGRHRIKLQLKNNMLTKSDAYVNTVHISHPFEGEGERSSTKDFIINMGKEEIKRQIDGFQRLKRGDFIKLEHPQLSAPSSYHILYYDDKSYDLDCLRAGITSVLNDAIKKNIKRLGFIALGYEYVNMVPKQEEKNAIAKELAYCTAESIVTFMMENKYKQIPEIYFNFVNVLTMMVFDKAFFYWCSLNHKTLALLKQATALEQDLINEAKTKNDVYIERIKKIAYCVREKTSLLFLGETGVGKTHFARVVHNNSNTAASKFVEINCAMIRSNSLYTELFGWIKGSYTDARTDGKGAVEIAEGGTLFLDEVGQTDLEVQKMLLLFLDSGRYSRYGERGVVRQANVRLIFGTNQNLEKLIKGGKFLPDLYHRIAQETILIPPLRERSEDIERYVTYFLQSLREQSGRNISISNEALSRLADFSWPGNIRQLKTFFENLFNYAHYKSLNEITLKMINDNPPQNRLGNEADPIEDLENILFNLLSEWNTEKGKFLHSVLGPVLAKVYIDDLGGNRKDASKFIGIEGTRGTDSKLEEYYQAYKKLNNL